MSTIADKLAARAEISKSVTEIYQTAQRCAELCAQFDEAIPDEVARLLGGSKQTTNALKRESGEPRWQPKRTMGPVPAPYTVPKPGWISFPFEDAQVATLVMISLRNETDPLSKRAVRERVQSLDSSIRDTTMHATWAKLEAEGLLVGVKDNALRLTDPSNAPGRREDRILGPHEVFAAKEVAGHRREAVLVALEAHGPLLRAEIIEALRASDWVHAPLADSLLLNDLKVLSEARKIRRGSDDDRDFRWELVPASETQKGPAQLRLATSM